MHLLAPEHPGAFGHMLQAIDFALADVREVALVGDDRGPLEQVVRETFRPHVVLAGGEPDGVPLLAGRSPVDGRAAAYVCEHFACRRPVTEPEETARAARPDPMSRLLTFPAQRTGKFIVLIAALVVVAALSPLSGKFEDAQENETVEWLPQNAESVKALKAIERFPDGEVSPAVTVISRAGGLTAEDRARGAAAGRGPQRQARRRTRATPKARSRPRMARRCWS